MSVLTQDISKSGRLSSSARVNFAEYDKKPSHLIGWILGIIGAVVLLAAGVYFGMILRYQEVYNENMLLVDAEHELEDITKKVAEANYAEIQKDYIRYSFQYLNDTEKNYADRKLILDKMESKIFNVGTITSFGLSGNQTSLTIYGLSPEESAYMKMDLLADPDHLFKNVDIKQVSGGKKSQNSKEEISITSVTIVFNTDAERQAAIRGCKNSAHDHSEKEEGGNNK